MKKRILSALLVLALALSLLPASALAAEPRNTNPIETVNFYYRNPGVVPEDYNWDGYYPLRNVFTVKIKGGISETERHSYKFAVKAGDTTGNPLDNGYKEVSTVYFNEPSLSTGKSSVAYFEAPDDVLTDTETKYTVRVTGQDESYNEAEIQLVKATFKANNGQNITKDEWSDEDKDHILIHNSASFIFVSKSDTYPAMPKLADKQDGADNEFVGWAENQGDSTNKLIEKIDTDKTLYAVFGERANPVLKVRTTNNNSGDEVSYQKAAEHTIQFGQTGAGALSLYVRNEGNRKYEKVYTVSTDHFNMTYEESDGCNKNQDNSGRVSYDIEVDKALEIKFTPKPNIPVGEYTDRVPLNNSTDRIIRFIDIKLTVSPLEANITADGITKEYGETKTSGDVSWTVENDDGDSIKQALEGGVSFTSSGFAPNATVTEEGYDILLNSATNGNYTAKWKDGQAPKVTVTKTTPIFANVAATSVKPGAQLNTSILTGSFTNKYTGDVVEGSLNWTTPETTVDTEEGSKSYEWTFNPTDSTNYNPVTGHQLVVITEGEPTTVSLKDPEYPMTVTYSGEGVDLSNAFKAVRGTEQPETVTEGIVVQYRQHQDMTPDNLDKDYSSTLPKDAGLYDVRAAIPGTEKYAAGYVVEHLKIEPKELTVDCTVAGKDYDGKKDATIESISVSGKIGEDDVQVDQESSTAIFETADAGENKLVTVTPGELTGTAASNYKLSAGLVTATATISKKPVTLRAKENADLTKTYGEIFALNLTQQFEADENGLVDGESLGTHISGEFSCAGVDSKAEVKDGGYPITFTASGGNYDVSLAEGVKLTVKKATPQLRGNTIQTSTGWSQGTLESVSLTGEFVNSVNNDMVVQGTLEWQNPNTSLSSAQDGKITATWKFTPTDTVNYVENAITGEVDVTVSASQPVVINGVEQQVVTYNGQTQAYDITGVTTEPAEAEITLMYRRHTDTDDEHQNTENFEAGQLPKDVGAWDVMILAVPDDAEQYIANSVIVHLNIEKARPQTDGVGPFSGREGTPLTELPGLPTSLPGVNGETVHGEFVWTAQNAAVTEETAQLDWSFIPTDSNYMEVGGKATVTMTEDTRMVTGTVYNLPAGYVDYITVALPKDENALKTGETVHFYSDEACETLLGTLNVPAGSETAEVELGQDALSSEGGKIYAKISGRKTQVCAIAYDAALSLGLENKSIYVGYTVDLTPAGEGVTAVYTVEEGADVLEAVDGANGTFKGLKAGTARVSVTATWPHPDAAKTDATITMTGSVTVTVTDKPAGGGSWTPSPSVTVKTDSTTNGSFTVSDKNAKAGDTVKITAKAGKGYVVDQVTVTDKSGKAVEVKANSDGTYSFVMPTKAAQPVTVKVTFKEEEQVHVCPSEKYTDVDASAWYHDGVDFAIENKLMVGTGENIFSPNGITTRAQLVTILYRLEGEPAVTKDIKFGDVPDGTWYTDAINWAAANGIVNGYSETRFGPDDPITREQMAAILHRYAGLKGYNVSGIADLSGYTDAGSVSSWARAAMQWAVSEGIIEGTSKTTLSPSGDSTRAQVATILMRFCKDVVK